MCYTYCARMLLNIVQHCCTSFKMNNIAQCCYINCNKIGQHNIVATCCTGSTVQAVQYRQYSRFSVFGRVELTLPYDRKQRPKMEISNSSRFILACKLLAIPIETEGSYLRGYGVMTEQTQKQYRQHDTSNLSTKLS